MKIEDLIDGEIYVSDVKNPGYIFKFNDKKRVNHFYLYSRVGYNTFSKGCIDSRENNSFSEYRNATTFEKNWFNACEKANKFIPQDQIPNNESLISNLIIW